MRARGVLLVLALGVSACATFRPLLAEDGDYTDYRAFRLAAGEGPRLAAATAYLQRHPRGAFAGEVRAAFAAEEPAYYQACTATRAQAIEYLATLPRGPHVPQALVLVRTFDDCKGDEETRRMLEAAKQTGERLDREQEGRRRAGEALREAAAVLLEPGTLGRPVAASPDLLRLLVGPVASTWGAVPPRVDERRAFVVRATTGPVSRSVAWTLQVREQDGVVVRGSLRGPGLFERWTEIETLQPIHDDNPPDRARAAAHVRELFSGMLEARFPAGRCAADDARALLLRRCDGVEVRVVQGDAPGDADTLTIAKTPSVAPADPTARTARGLRHVN